ncbi:MAG: ORF6N domain-containing protein [Flavobacteriaceae bacterium]|nr:ORF6N domain-containing protein [Flavobacteriaceae bacterium]
MHLVSIQNKIFEIHEVSVMLDFDLAELYEVETRVLNRTKQDFGLVLIKMPSTLSRRNNL